MNPKYIRNFSIIAHIDHGKSTLADRMLEITHTIEKRKMMDQVLDNMELEREKGITIKMRPVRMFFEHKSEKYLLNLIDTPGHIDFSYEVSRALKAVEGCLLLVDATQGIQAQTLTVLEAAKKTNLKIIPVVTKIDSPIARIEDIKSEISNVLKINEDEIIEVSGKTGVGVQKLLEEIIEKIPAPKNLLIGEDTKKLQALVFDFQFTNHKGVIVFIRVMSGEVKKGDKLMFSVSKEQFEALEVGIFAPEEVSVEKLTEGQIGYIVTGIKQPGIASVGDTIVSTKNPAEGLSGYVEPKPVVWASVFPSDADDFKNLELALKKLRLSDSAFTFEEESSGSLGRGFRCGFLGLLHLEIITERLKREFNLNLIIATPSITYEIVFKTGKKETIYSPSLFPDEHLIESIREPWVKVTIIAPEKYTGPVYQLFYEHEAELHDSETFTDGRNSMTLSMPLRELMRNFFDELKSVSSGFASLSYEFEGLRDADVCRMDILVADEPVVAFASVIAKRRVEEDANKAVDKLHAVLPRQMFATKIQAKAMGRIIASRSISALKKDVTQHMYGGDITRKMKLREKQKKGKKKMKDRGTVNIPQDVFLKMMKRDSN